MYPPEPQFNGDRPQALLLKTLRTTGIGPRITAKMFFPTMRRMEIMPRSTYYDKHYKMTSAMIRARQQYLVKNIFTGIALGAFVIGVCTRLLSSLYRNKNIADFLHYRCIYNPRSGSRRSLRRAYARSAATTRTSAEHRGGEGGK